MTLEQLRRLPETERQSYYKTLPFSQQLELAMECATQLNAVVERIPLTIMDAWESRLASDGKSAQATQDLMARLKSV